MLVTTVTYLTRSTAAVRQTQNLFTLTTLLTTLVLLLALCIGVECKSESWYPGLRQVLQDNLHGIEGWLQARRTFY